MLSKMYEEIKALKLELIGIENIIEYAPEKIQLLNFQLNEIESANLKTEEDKRLEKQFKKYQIQKK